MSLMAVGRHRVGRARSGGPMGYCASPGAPVISGPRHRRAAGRVPAADPGRQRCAQCAGNRRLAAEVLRHPHRRGHRPLDAFNAAGRELYGGSGPPDAVGHQYS